MPLFLLLRVLMYLLADLDGFRRIGSVEPFLQAGGDLSAKEGWRIAVSLIWQISESKDEAMQIIQKLGLCEEKEAKVLLAMLERKINAVESTSAGRLFDVSSAIFTSVLVTISTAVFTNLPV